MQQYWLPKTQLGAPMPLPPSDRSFVVTKATGFYPEFNVLLIAMQSVGVASEFMLHGNVTFQPGDYVNVEALHLKHGVHLPLYGPVQAALQNRQPDTIHITVDAAAPPAKPGFQTAGFVAFTNAIFLPFLVAFHERTRPALTAKFSTDRTRWPEPWQMSWAIRNAASHNGMVFERSTQRPVSWRGLAFGPCDEPAKKLLSLVNGGDIILLLRDMEETLTGVQLKDA